MTITSLMGNVGEVFTEVISWIGDVTGTIANDPLLLMGCVAIPLCGIAIRMTKRLLSVDV